jgi:hypothetical protein
MERRFIYHSGALAFGGQVSRPFNEVLEAQAASLLPPTGGHGRARVDNYNWRDLVSFRAAYSTVSGSASADGKVYNTLATVTVEGLNVMDVVTADKVVARLTSEHPRDSDELPILPVGSYFENLRIAGIPVDVRPHPALLRSATAADLQKACGGKPSPFVDPDGNAFSFESPLGARKLAGGKGGAAAPSFDDRLMLTSLFEDPARAVAGLEGAGVSARPGCQIVVPDFGSVFLGEYLITRYSRRLTMIRLELGSPIEGTVVVSNLQGNGHTYP